MSASPQSRPLNENRILSALPPEDYERLAPHLELVKMPHGQILYKAGERIEQIYFPLNSMISFVSLLSDGSGAEVGVTGFEGMTGLSIVLGVDRTPHETMVQVDDGAMRLSADVLLDEFKRGGALQALLLRYAHSFLLQVSQVATCNRLHSVEERLARWLLMSDDRCVCDDLPLTHQFLALMLGVRRAGVTTSALALQAEGFIHYSRGHIKITDRQGLEGFACECYQIIKEEFDRITNGTKNAVEGRKLMKKREDDSPSFIETLSADNSPVN